MDVLERAETPGLIISGQYSLWNLSRKYDIRLAASYSSYYGVPGVPFCAYFKIGSIFSGGGKRFQTMLPLTMKRVGMIVSLCRFDGFIVAVRQSEIFLAKTMLATVSKGII